jgi:hypothetical protein
MNERETTMIQQSSDTCPPGSGGASRMQTQGAESQSTSSAADAKEKVRDVTRRVKETASQAAAQAREKATKTAQKQKDMAADHLTALADALNETSQSLKDRDDQAVASLTGSAAKGLEQVSSYVRDRDLAAIFDDVQGWARRHPALFLGGCFLAGTVAARFLKTSAEKRRQRDGSDMEYLGDDFTGSEQASWRPQQQDASAQEISP